MPTTATGDFVPDLESAAALAALREAMDRAAISSGQPAPEITAVQVVAQRHSGGQRDPHPFSCQLLLNLRAASGGTAQRVRYHGRGYREAAAAEAAAERSRAAGLSAPPLGAPLLHLPAWNLLLWAWPNDPALPQLAALTTLAGAQAALPADLAPLVRVVGVEAVSHAALRHAVLRVTWVAAERCSARLRALGLARAGVFYAKSYAGLMGHEVQARNDYFWQLSRQSSTAPHVARPLGHVPDWRTVWQAAAPGLPLADLLSTAKAEAALAVVARGLARLHGVPYDIGARHDLAYWMAEIERRRRKLVRLVPQLTLQVEALAGGLQAAAPTLAPMRMGTAHGDFQFGQCLVQDEHAVLLDFDSLVSACPMEDLAEFIVKLHTLPLAPERIATLAQVLQAAYAHAAPWHFDPAWLLWHTAVQHLLQASRAVMSQPGGAAAGATGNVAAARPAIEAALHHLRALRELDLAVSA